MRASPATVLAAALLVSPLVAEGETPEGSATLGEIAARIDAVDHLWQTRLPDAEGAELTTHFSDFGFVWQVRLLGDGADEIALPGSLEVVFSGIDGDKEPTERQIVFDEIASGKRFVSRDNDTGAVIVDLLDLSGNPGFAEGRISAELCRRDGVFGTIDPEDCVVIEGRFTSRLPFDE